MAATEVLLKKNILTPKLRFKEFSVEWKNKNIAAIAELTSSKRVYLSDYVESGIPFYRGKEISELKKNIVPNDILYITESSYLEFKEKYGVPQKNDILITAVGTLGNVLRIQNDDKFYFKDGNLIWFRKITESAEFLEIILEVKKLDIEKTSIGSTQRALTMVELRKLILPFPTLPEQKKIASFLSIIDEKMQQLIRKKELLEQYKKGVMQQLFSGKLRFKDEKGKAFPKWEEHKLIDVADKKIKWSFTGGPFGSDLKSEDYTENGVRILQLQNIGDGVFNNEYKIYTSEEKADKLISCNIYPGEILISKMGDPVARACKIPFEDKRYLMASDGIRFVPDSNKFDNDFIFHSINYRIFRKKALKLSTGSTRKRIGLTELKAITFNTPSLAEQKKIALYISNIDNKIENVTKQITQSQTFKKGLLQKMFV